MRTSQAVAILLGGCIVSACLVSCNSAGSGPPPRALFPPRPADIAVERIRPCSMFSAPQEKALDLFMPVERRTSVDGAISPICTWNAGTELTYNAQTIPLAADGAAEEPGAAVININGFGAVRGVVTAFTGGAPSCQVTIDAAPNSTIRVQARGSSAEPRRSDDEMCRLATEAAQMVMTTVVATASR